MGGWCGRRAFATSRSSIGGRDGGEWLSLRVALTPTQHFSSRTPLDRNRALWGGSSRDRRPSDLLRRRHRRTRRLFRDVRQRLRPIDLALLPIGAYEPRWFMQVVHMNPAEAVQAHLDLGRRRVSACTFGTIPDSPRKGSMSRSRARRGRAARQRLRPHDSGLWAFGESFRVRGGGEPVT